MSILMLASGPVALAACTANPPAGTPTTTTAQSPSVQRQAGVFAKDIILTVFNDTNKLIYVRTCMYNFEDYPQTCEKWGLSEHTSMSRTGNNTFEGVVAYEKQGIEFEDPNRPLRNFPEGMIFVAENPEAETPRISWFTDAGHTGDRTTVSHDPKDYGQETLVVGAQPHRIISGHEYGFERPPDESSGVKNLVVRVVS